MRRLRSALGKATIDVTALRASADFRKLFIGHTLSAIGSQVTVVALMYQMYDITGSTLAVGLIGLAQFVPTVVFSLVGGAVADAMDRRRLLVLVQVAMCIVAVALALLALGTPARWQLLALAAIGAGFASLDGPARTAIVPNLVRAEHLRSAVQLREVMTQTSRAVGPALGGIVIKFGGVGLAYALDAATFVASFVAFLMLPSLVPASRRRFELGSIVEGLGYIRRSRALAGTFVADLVAMIVGMPRAVFPAFAATVFLVGPDGVGYMYAAPAVGAMIGVVFAGWTGHVRREGLAVIMMIGLWGAFITAFAVTSSFPLALLMLALAGMADTYSAIFRQTMLLAIVPEELRGRMSSIHIMVVTGGPPLGDFKAGGLADVMGLRESVAVGGLGCIVGMGVLSAFNRPFRTWTDPRRVHEPPAELTTH